MARHERYGTRDLTFSRWHRTLSDDATCIDLDFCEYCRHCKQPLALLETARDVGQSFKPTTILNQLAIKANLPAYVILYSLDGNNPHGIGVVRLAKVAPTKTALQTYTLEQIGRWIEAIHASCSCRMRIDTPHGIR